MTITNRVSLKSVMAGNTPVPDVVDAPTIGTATAGVESATVTFTAATTGGAATTFGAISTPGSITGTSATSPITVSGLTAGTAYTFKTYGINSSGTWSNVLSAASNSVTPTASTSYESIATITVGGGGQASVEFTSIPSTYTHLQLRGLGRNTAGAAGGSNLELQFNTDTATNYSSHYLRSNGSTTSAGAYTTSSRIYFIETIARNGNTAGSFGTFAIDILDYTNTNKYKTVRGLGGYDNNGSGYILFGSGNWRSTSAISSVKVILEGGDTFAQYSQWALYGIKGS